MYYCTTELYYYPFLNMLENADFDNLNKTRNKKKRRNSFYCVVVFES